MTYALALLGIVAALVSGALAWLRKAARSAAALAVVAGGTLPGPRETVDVLVRVVTRTTGGHESALGTVAPWMVAAVVMLAFACTVRASSLFALGWGVALLPALALIPGPAERVGSSVVALIADLAGRVA